MQISVPCCGQTCPESYALSFKVPEGHHPRGTTLREALRGNFPLRGLCGGLSEGSAGSLRGFCGVSAGFCGGPRDFPRVLGGSDPMLVTLRNCWIEARHDYTINSETFLLCDTCARNWNIKSQKILVCNWRSQEIPSQKVSWRCPNYTKEFSPESPV